MLASVWSWQTVDVIAGGGGWMGGGGSEAGVEDLGGGGGEMDETLVRSNHCLRRPVCLGYLRWRLLGRDAHRSVVITTNSFFFFPLGFEAHRELSFRRLRLRGECYHARDEEMRSP